MKTVAESFEGLIFDTNLPIAKADEIVTGHFGKVHNSEVAADTFLGPFYLAIGSSNDGEVSGYLYLGEKF